MVTLGADVDSGIASRPFINLFGSSRSSPLVDDHWIGGFFSLLHSFGVDKPGE
jgi:hypothetical protein